MTFIKMLEQNGAVTTFVIWIIVSFLLGLFIGSIRSKAKARETEEIVPSPVGLAYSPQATSENKRLIAAITAAVNEYRTNDIRANNIRPNDIRPNNN